MGSGLSGLKRHLFPLTFGCFPSCSLSALLLSVPPLRRREEVCPKTAFTKRSSNGQVATSMLVGTQTKSTSRRLGEPHPTYAGWTKREQVRYKPFTGLCQSPIIHARSLPPSAAKHELVEGSAAEAAPGQKVSEVVPRPVSQLAERTGSAAEAAQESLSFPRKSPFQPLERVSLSWQKQTPSSRQGAYLSWTRKPASCRQGACFS
jgi:hypothetical protein